MTHPPRVLLTYPRAHHELGVPSMENLSIGALSAYLQRHGIRVDLLDCAVDDVTSDQVDRFVDARSYSVAGVSIISRFSLDSALELARTLRAASPGLHIVAGGKLPTGCPADVLFEGSPFDSVILYEGEGPLLELVRSIEAGETWTDLPGLCHLAAGQVVRNPPELGMVVADLDALPYPDRAMLPKFIRRGAPTLISASRGCSFACDFCVTAAESRGLWGRSHWRGRSPQSIVGEMEWLMRSYDVGEIWFVDDLFLGPMPRGVTRARRICAEIRRRELEVGFSIEARTDSVVANRELFLELRDAGLRRVFLGVESGDDATLKAYNKATSADKHLAAVRFLRDAGIEVNVGFMLFDPFKRLPTLRREAQFLSALAEERVFFPPVFRSGLQLLKDTPMYSRVESAGLLIEDGCSVYYSYQDPRVECVEKILHWLYVSRNEALFDVLLWLIGLEWRKREAFPGAEHGPDDLELLHQLSTFVKRQTLNTLVAVIGLVEPWAPDTEDLIYKLDLSAATDEVDRFTAELLFLARAYQYARDGSHEAHPAPAA